MAAEWAAAELYGLDAQRIEVVPNGVDSASVPCIGAAARRRVAVRRPGQSTAALFMGSWHGPNIEAARFIVETLAPALPACAFWIVGSVCRFDFRNLPENVTLFGQLSEADKNAVLSSAQIAINPVQTGSGSNLKMAEYAAAGIPIVSTPFGCRGLELSGFEHLVQAEMHEFVENLETIVNQSAQGALDAMSTCTEPAASTGHDWHGIADNYFQHIVSVCGKYVYSRAPW